MHAAVFVLGSILATDPTEISAASGLPSAEQHASVQASAPGAPLEQRRGTNPHGRLFTPRPERRVTVRAAERSFGDARNVCGMKVITANPDVDRKIVLPIPPGTHKTSRIRAIEPPPCARR